MLTWTDQPLVLVDAEILCSLYVRNIGLIEVRRNFGLGFYYLTVGSLFGSQTIQTNDHISIFKLFEQLNNKEDMRKLPPGCNVIK